MLTSATIGQIAPALVKAWAAIEPATKDAVNPHFKNEYSSLGAVLEAIRAAFLPNKLCLIQSCEQSDDAGVSVTSTALHESGEWVSCVVRVPLEKASAQGVGSAISYGRRYGAGALAGLWSEGDDDGTTATQYQRPAKAHSNGKGAADKVMPFGKSKGSRLGDLGNDVLASTVTWCREKDEKKFADLIGACEQVMEDRRLEGGNDEAPY